MSLRRTVMHRSLHRPNLVMGGERELTLIMLCVSAALAGMTMNLPGIISGLALYGLSLGLLQRMAQHDPQLTAVYIRYVRKYRNFYEARSRHWRTE